MDGNHQFGISYQNTLTGVVLDVGSGKRPFLSSLKKAELGATITGLDISLEELQQAPRGVYDEIIVADICQHQGNDEADFVMCQALLEHVPDTRAAIRAMASCLKPGGHVIAFVPCRNAAFARLNLLLPESWKRHILFTIYPHVRHSQGFPAYYDECTPRRIKSICEESGLLITRIEHFYCSSYFQSFFPVQFLWRLWSLLIYRCGLNELCETFSFTAKKV